MPIADEVVVRLQQWIIARLVDRVPSDSETSALLYDALTVIKELQEEITELHLK